MSLIMLFIVDRNSAEMYILIASAIVDLTVCIVSFASIRIGDKKDK